MGSKGSINEENMRKRIGLFLGIFLIVLLIVTCFGTSGCSKLESTETVAVEASIQGTNYRDSYVSLVLCGKVFIPITHPEEWNTNILYKGVYYSLDDEESFSICDGYDGEKVICVLNIITYDDGYVDYEIEEIICLEE